MFDLPPAPAPDDTIIITAARTAQPAGSTAASASVIDRDRLERLGVPLAGELLRLVPSAAVAQSGSPGTVAEVRIRGAEANHTLLFLDGIRVNDPARGNAPRFELLNADLASRIEVVRGPQSALWGSEAIGGVVAVDGSSEGERMTAAGTAEAGTRGFARGSASLAAPGLAAALAFQRGDGIDIFGGGDRDGYCNLAGRVLAKAHVTEGVEVGANGFLVSGRSQFDGSDPFTYARSHDLASRDRMVAGRVWAGFGGETSRWVGKLSVSRLHSTSRNYFADDETNRTSGRRTTLGGQIEHRFATGAVAHQLVVAGEIEREQFAAEDSVYGGATEQKQRRSHDSLTAEWRSVAGPLTLDLAARHDRFNRFRDATSVRASGLVNIGQGWSLAASYGEGIAQPTFFDLFGFFPGSFVGNPSLRPESSTGYEVSLRLRRSTWSAAATLFQQRLKDEIVETFDFDTLLASTVNADGASRRRGVELEAAWTPDEALRVSGHYAYLEADQPAGGGALREVRRPRHSGAVALDGVRGRLSFGASLNYSGARIDNNFEIPPFGRVRLGAYWLAGGRLAYAITPRVELFGRVSNALGERYQDVFAYRTEGRTLYAGIRLADRR
ncbi:TonB-dependent receptor plug domain-containing protein [Sphingomonas mesophila]|uniref:TonB-dependent receptor plug domain-containing protein n=1 Tax=Sphingomonas mesophila TaxID=2303576 RepID=UPI0013C2D4BC|nr:TonB-dependent receptor [Sphingomonas mesophila]